jgi:hypothetical protein
MGVAIRVAATQEMQPTVLAGQLLNQLTCYDRQLDKSSSARLASFAHCQHNHLSYQRPQAP